jgi:hypothetical protein
MGSGGAEQPLGSPQITGEEIARIIGGNLVNKFERLRNVPGFRLEPVPWELATKLVDANSTESLGKLGRSPAGQVVYWKFKSKVIHELMMMFVIKTRIAQPSEEARQACC